MDAERDVPTGLPDEEPEAPPMGVPAGLLSPAFTISMPMEAELSAVTRRHELTPACQARWPSSTSR